MLADTTLRDADEQQRLKLEALMREVEKRRASVTVISTEHEAGAKLLSLGGIAALLRFPITERGDAINSLILKRVVYNSFRWSCNSLLGC